MSASHTRSNRSRSRHIRFDRRVSPLAAFASDLDRTLVNVGSRPSSEARAALREAKDLGLRTLVVSGRRYPELVPYVRGLRYVDGIVAENGAIVEAPMGSAPRVFGRRIGGAVRARLAARPPFEVEYGDVVVSVQARDGPRLRRAVVGLPVDLIGNVRHLMALPRGIGKGSGARRAVRELGLGRHAYAAIGDAENDLDLLRGARLSGAVANAEPAVRRAVDYVCHARYESGVLEFVRGPLTEHVRGAPD